MSQGDDTLGMSEAERVDAICERFEQAWSAGRQPAIEEYLGGAQGPAGAALLERLLKIELYYRLRAGQTPTAEPYLARFPDHGELIGRLVRTAPREVSTRSIRRAAAPDDTTVPLPPGQEGLQPGQQGPVPVALDGMAGTETAASGSGQGTVAARPPAEGRVGRFRLQAELGRGGFGKVYLAHDPQLDRLVALKVSKRAFEGPEEAQRFLGEAMAAARLRHPNIVAVFDSGQDGDTYFIASEYVDGLSLDKWLKARRPPFRPTVGWVRDLALALDYAHGQGT